MLTSSLTVGSGPLPGRQRQHADAKEDGDDVQLDQEDVLENGKADGSESEYGSGTDDGNEMEVGMDPEARVALMSSLQVRVSAIFHAV